MIPPKLKSGDIVAIIAPSKSISIIPQHAREIADKRFLELGLVLVFGKHVEETDAFGSSAIVSRVEDIHAAFADPAVKGIFAVIGGFNCNQLLRYLDWDLIKKNPKIFCGYSDTTAMQNAIYAKTGLVTYSTPAYSTFGQKLHFEYALEYFKKCCIEEGPYAIEPSADWSDDHWYRDQDNRHLISNPGWNVIHEGMAEGIILGANLCTFNLLQGTEYFPDLKDSILFIEDDEESNPQLFDRDLQSLIHQPSFSGVRGIVIGRFQGESNISEELLRAIIESKRELSHLPIIAGVDFGHTDPKISFPIGGKVRIEANSDTVEIKILEH